MSEVSSKKVYQNKVLEILFNDGDKKTLYRTLAAEYGIEKQDVDKYIRTLVDQGFISRPVALPTEKALRKLGWTIVVILIKLNLSSVFESSGPNMWIEQGRIMKALACYMQKEYDDFRIFFIGTPVGWRYDLVVFAYTKGISKGFSEFASKVTKLLPTVEVVTHPFVHIKKFEPMPYTPTSEII